MFEGKVLTEHGRGLSDFTIRELCNLVYFHHVNQFQQPSDEDDPDIAEQIEIFEEKIGQRVSSSTKAEAALRNLMILQGKDPDAKPELSPELAARMEEDALRMASDEEIMFNYDKYAGKELRGKAVKPGSKDFE